MKTKLSLILLFAIIFLSSFAQKSQNIFNGEGENAIYTKEWGVGLRFYTNGISAFYEHVWIKDIKKRKLIQANFFIYSDFRERKIQSFKQVGASASKYYYGKINNFYSLNLMYGYRTVIANKAETSGVKLSLTYMAGLTIGALKPYYLKFEKIGNDGVISYISESYTDENSDKFLDDTNSSTVVGPGNFFNGFNRMRILPGLQAKIGLNFDFARKNNIITSLEVGTQLDVFYNKVNTYIVNNNKPYILNLYLSIQVGKRA